MTICPRVLTIAVLIAASASLALAAETPTIATNTSGPVKIVARVDKATARVAEPIELVVEVEAPKGVRVELPTIANKNLGNFEVKHSERLADIPSATNSGLRTWKLSLTLETIKTGDLTIPPLEAHYAADAAATLSSVSSAPIQVRIASVLENRADPKKFRDIKQTVDVPVPTPPSRGWIAWTAGAGGVLAALFVAVAVMKRRRRGPAPAAWALTTLADLEPAADSPPTDAEELFNEVVHVIREFFELEFNVPALPLTSREFLAEAQTEVGLPAKASERLKWLASVADEIKFARLGVSDKHVREAFAQAKAFIAECEAHRLQLAKGVQ